MPKPTPQRQEALYYLYNWGQRISWWEKTKKTAKQGAACPNPSSMRCHALADCQFVGIFYPYCRQATLLHLLPTSHTLTPTTAEPHHPGRRRHPGQPHCSPLVSLTDGSSGKEDRASRSRAELPFGHRRARLVRRRGEIRRAPS